MQYSEYILSYFSSVKPAGHTRVLNLDKSVRKWSGSVNNISLDKFAKFRFLEICHYSKITGESLLGGDVPRVQLQSQKVGDKGWI